MNDATVIGVIGGVVGSLIGYEFAKTIYKNSGYDNGYRKGYRSCESTYRHPFMVGRIEMERISRIVSDKCPACGSSKENWEKPKL